MKTALVLSGGGANGAYQAGVIGFLFGELGVDPEIVCGTSVGALNALQIAHFPLGQPLKAARAVFDVWHNIEGNDDVYREWPVVGALAALWKSSIYDTRPLRQMVAGIYDRVRVLASGRELHMVAVELGSGLATVWRETDDDLLDGVMGSAAFPVMFPPARARGRWWVDGGVRDVTPIGQAIDAGAERIYVVITDPEDPSLERVDKWNAIKIATRTLGLLVNEVMRGDLKLAHARNHLPEYRDVDIIVIRPRAPLGDSFDFSRNKNHRLIAAGEQDARALLG